MNDRQLVDVNMGPDAKGIRCMNFRGRIKRYPGSMGESRGNFFVLDEEDGGGYWTPYKCIKVVNENKK